MKDAILSVLRRKKYVPAGKIVSSGPKPLSVEADVLIKLKSSKKKRKSNSIQTKRFASTLQENRVDAQSQEKNKKKKKEL